jgi:holo-[acyl-carrier protein] synthase
VLQKFGLGTDIVRVKRFENKPFFDNQRFYKKIFLDSEIKYCLKYNDNAIHFSGKFAVKESVKKSISKNVNFLDIETYHINSKPNVKLQNNQNYNFLVSISHEKEFAVATVISENLN